MKKILRKLFVIVCVLLIIVSIVYTVKEYGEMQLCQIPGYLFCVLVLFVNLPKSFYE